MSGVVVPFVRRLRPDLSGQVRQRGYAPIYHHDQVNHCPGCTRTQWHVGRVSAECAFCGTALFFVEPAPTNTNLEKDV